MTLSISHSGLQLIFSGALLFLIGMVQGTLIPKFKNSRMALSAHTTAAQSGMALMIFGLAWQLVTLPELWLVFTKSALILSLYLIWLGLIISAITGASRALPIAGEGYSGSPANELFVASAEAIGGLILIAACIAVLVGLVQSF